MSFDSFEQARDHYRQQGMTVTAAMSKAARDHPDLLHRYREAGTEWVAKANEQPRRLIKSGAELTFEQIAGEIAKRDQLPSHIAMSRARQERPDLYAEAYA